jgi:hypothetical protein
MLKDAQKDPDEIRPIAIKFTIAQIDSIGGCIAAITKDKGLQVSAHSEIAIGNVDDARTKGIAVNGKPTIKREIITV